MMYNGTVEPDPRRVERPLLQPPEARSSSGVTVKVASWKIMTGKAAHVLKRMRESGATWEENPLHILKPPPQSICSPTYLDPHHFMDCVLWGHMQSSHPCKRCQSDTL